MPKLPINAHIVDIGDETFYPVKIDWVPRVGDLISLYSFIDAADNLPAQHYYEVVRVLHEFHDIAEDVEQSHKGFHFVRIFVKISEDALFDPSVVKVSPQ